MNYQEFIDKYNGTSFDYDGVSGIQCVDLIKMYLDKVFGMRPGAFGNAKDYFENFDNLPLKNVFDKISNTADFIPAKGDICVWGAELGNQYGHIAIATGKGDTKEFKSYDLNWGNKIVHEVSHTYKGFLGVLRAKDQSKIITQPDIQYKVHLQDIGWTEWKKLGEVAGTVGEARQIEAIILQGNNGVDLSYRVHMDGLGWGEFVQNGEVAGTTGQNRRIEAIEIKSNKTLQVQEHVQDIGWMPVSKGTQIHIGTEGKTLRLEAFKIEST